MSHCTRRDLFADIGTGMVAASVGAALASDLGFAAARAADGPNRLTFGDLDPLVDLLRDTPPDALMRTAVEKLRAGTDLKQFVAAAALTNARAFGGEDYVGFHTLMALAPAYLMASEEPDPARKPLAVLKVLHRNATRLGEVGANVEVLKPVVPGRLDSARRGGEQIRDSIRRTDLLAAEAAFAAVCNQHPERALDELMLAVDDDAEVHRVVLVSRAWDLSRFVGSERARTLLRQSVRYCLKSERSVSTPKRAAELRSLLPALLDQHKLLAISPGTRQADDAWVAGFADTLLQSAPAAAAEAVASALAEGFPVETIGEALSLAANQLVLRDNGRPKEWAQANKPVGSVHGDSTGVHACDSIHAWRSLARFGDRRTQVTSLVLAGYQIGRDRAYPAGLVAQQPYPRSEHCDAVRNIPVNRLLIELDAAVKATDQGRAAALAARLGAESSSSASAVFSTLRKHAISQDGALHAEKYYTTTADEFARGRPSFRWRQLVALARVSASMYGYSLQDRKEGRAPGYQEACRLLGV